LTNVDQTAQLNGLISWQAQKVKSITLAQKVSKSHHIVSHPPFLANCSTCAQVSFKAPLNWKHAGLDSVRLFLKEEIARGNYKPIIEGGL